MTLLVRDEQDIIAANIDYHLAQGVDFIIVTDNLSLDRTPEILKKYEKKGKLKVINEFSDNYSQYSWVTRMAKMAFVEYHADWVINSDADEFWMPNSNKKNLKDILANVPANIFACKVNRLDFLPPLDEGLPFYRSMLIRDVESKNAIGQLLPPKLCHRGCEDILVRQGNHHVEVKGKRVQPESIPITILHFPLRSYWQFENKIKKGGSAYARNTEIDKDLGSTWRKLFSLYEEGSLEDYYRQQRPSEEVLDSALKNNDLIRDTRLLDFMNENQVNSTMWQSVSFVKNKYQKHIAKYFSSARKRNARIKSEASEGIITLADANYFPGLVNLYFSVQESYDVPIVCYDVGLSEGQKQWAKKYLKNLRINVIPDNSIIDLIKKYPEESLAKKGKRVWPLWICPLLIQESPFVKTLWLDCDVIILRNLDMLFKKLDEGPIFTPENLAPHVTANKPELYEFLPINRKFSEVDALINAGVSGWHLQRDKCILNDYVFVVKQAFQDSDIKNSISWHDQGALIWAILNNGLEHRVERGWEWNLCIKNTSIKNIKFTWSNEVLDELKQKVPEANILHWNGQRVPWLD